MEFDPKLIAIYFPQFHAIPENDQWWGEGFNDWKLVENAKPLFTGHDQPKVPLDGMYNPCDKETLQHQAALARKYGIHGFMFYHYWFDGKLLLEKPMETLRDNDDVNINYCVCWANGTWTRAWEGKHEILIEQKHTNDPEIWKAHFNYLLPFFKDRRAIRKDGKPVFLIYQPNLLNNTKEMFKIWNQLAIQNGLLGLYIIAIKNYDFRNHTDFLNYYDGLMKFQPREAFTSNFFKGNSTNRFQILRRLPPSLWKIIQDIYLKVKSYTIVNGDNIWKVILQQAYISPYTQYGLDIYECGFFEWDNTSRYKDKAKIFTRPEKSHLEKYLKELFVKAREHKSEFIFWNAWNEWSEGAYLEPDTRRGYENLELLNSANTPPHQVISICIATYNGANYIKAQLESILIQLSDEDEIIISDDQSIDGTLDIVKDINDDRIKIYHHDKVFCSSSSSYATKNFENALSHANGDIIFLADQDDVWLPNKIQIMVQYLKKYDMVISDAYITDAKLEIIHNTRFYHGCGQTQNLFKAYFSTHPYQGSCMAFNRRVLSKALPFPKHVTSHDTWLGYLGNSFFKAKLIPEKLMYYRRHENVISITGGKSQNSIIFKLMNRLKYLTLVLLRGWNII